MIKGIKEKLIAGIGTVWFLSLITTNANPKLWQVAAIGIGIYEAVLLAVRIAKVGQRERRRKINNVARQRDAHAWAEEWFNPYKGVRA